METLAGVRNALDEAESAVSMAQATLSNYIDVVDKLKTGLSEVNERIEELEAKSDNVVMAPETVTEELSIAIFRDMAKSLSLDQIEELDAYARLNFKNYIKLES